MMIFMMMIMMQLCVAGGWWTGRNPISSASMQTAAIDGDGAHRHDHHHGDGGAGHGDDGDENDRLFGEILNNFLPLISTYNQKYLPALYLFSGVFVPWLHYCVYW